MKNFKYFAWFIWLGLGITFFVHNMHATPYFELAAKSAAMTFVMYVFVNYVYISTMMNAIKDKNNFVLIWKTLMMSVVETCSLVVIFNMLEDFHVFHFTDFSEFLLDVFTFSVEEWLGMFFIAIILNFGFYGLNFFQTNLELQKKLSESQLQTLQAQINPHFMFNVLNHINVLMVKKDVDLASDLLVKYSDILRYQLYSSRNPSNTLLQEIDFLKDFIDVEQLRWSDKLDVNTRWSFENSNFKLSPLLLIVLVENAFKHVSRSVEQRGYIHIDLEQKEDQLSLTIQNSLTPGSRPALQQKSKGIGLRNLKERLQILYPQQHQLQIEELENQYTIQLTLKEINEK